MAGKSIGALFKMELEGRTISQDSTIEQAIHVFQSTNARSLLAQDSSGRGVGILSEHDVVKAFAEHGDDVKDKPVKNYMTLDLVVAEHDADLDYVIKLMAEHNIRHMPVVSPNGKVVSFLNVMQILMAKLQSGKDDPEKN